MQETSNSGKFIVMKLKHLIIVLLALTLTGCGETIIGKPAPDFDGMVIHGGDQYKVGDRFALSKRSGKPIILYFFASW